MNNDAQSYKKLIIQAILAIDWDQQDTSRYFIGEDAAERLLMAINYDWNLGVSNEEIEKFIQKTRV